jgi:GNAT superfamily N-acetyltransferase
MATRLRTFADADYPRLVEIANLLFPDYRRSEVEMRHWDSTWEHDRYYKLRLVAVDDDDRALAVGAVSHMPHQFHPDKYEVDVSVDPAFQRRGIGSMLLDRLTADVRGRGAVLVRSSAKESMPESVAFLAHRGYQEVQRFWESRLDLASFDFGQFAGAEERAAREGITISTLEAERARGEDAVRKAYDLDRVISHDIPMTDPMTETSFERFVQQEIEGPNLLPDGWFIAKDGERFVGVSNLFTSEELPDVLYQGLTGVLREYRGKGIAMALKLRGVRYAQARGAREIRTWNNTRNRPMLRINEAMGFQKQPVWIEFEKPL